MKKRIGALIAAIMLALLLGMPAQAKGETETAQRVGMTVTLSKGNEGKEDLLTDDLASTYVLFHRAGTVRAEFTGPAQTLVTVWESDPENVTLRCFAGDTLLNEEPMEIPYLSTRTALPAGTTAVELAIGGEDTKLSGLYAYGEGELPESEYDWTAAAHPDVLLIVGYPGDELRLFGGLLPQLLNDGASVAVLYISCTRSACAAIRSVWRSTPV